ncbi:MAG: hypothetical protein OEL87_01850, partial [Nanoarchaeota archaeon]|nr:hypothetical protein [Nanoarchaeota archaeon]
MKNIGKRGIIGLILKLIAIIVLIFLIKQAYAQQITPEIITTTFQDVSPTILDTIDRFYEISERSLEIGYNVTLDNDSAFRTTIDGKDRYIIVNNFSEDTVNLAFIGSGNTLFNRPLISGGYVIFKIGDLNLQFILHKASKLSAQVELKLFKQEVPIDADYFQLFDVQVRLAEYVINQPTDLTALVEFINFGEGPSHIRIVYSIIDTSAKEFYTGIDERVVETNEVVVKNFDTLDIPYGDYLFRTTIYYGDNQEATSEESFSLVEASKFQILKQPLFFIAIVLAGFILVIFFRKK